MRDTKEFREHILDMRQTHWRKIATILYPNANIFAVWALAMCSHEHPLYALTEKVIRSHTRWIAWDSRPARPCCFLSVLTSEEDELHSQVPANVSP